MRGFLSLEPDPATLGRIVAVQNRLRDTLSRQGVHFLEAERLGAPLLAWPFATSEELEVAAEAIESLLPLPIALVGLSSVHGRPNNDRPAEVGFALLGIEQVQNLLFDRLEKALDPDPPKAAFIRLVRVSPPSRKVGAALHGTDLADTEIGPFRPIAFKIWRQSPQGFEPCRTMPLTP